MLTEYMARIALHGVHAVMQPRVPPLSETRTPMRVWPTDIDINGHINNGRYLTLMDFARWEHATRTGMTVPLLRRKWWPLLGAATVRFRRELRALSRYEIVTRTGAWDSKWLYMEQRFEQQGEVYAVGLVKAVIRHGREPIPPAEVFALLGYSGPSPEPSEELAKWMQTQRR